MSYKLFGASASPFVRKVMVYLAEKGLDFESDPVNPFDPPDNYRTISPLGKIPSLTDGDKSLADSSVICNYLERRHPSPALYPSDDYTYAQALWIEEFIDSGFVPKAGGGIFFPLVVAPAMGQSITAEVTAAAQKTLSDDIEPMWSYLNETLGDGEFFVGDMLTVGDIAVASVHVNLFHAGVDVDPKRWPKLANFIERMHARPSFKTIIDAEAPQWSRREESLLA